MGIKKAYLVALLATNLAIGFDYSIFNHPRIERGETLRYLQVQKYKVKVCGTEKNLTLVGENHWYTREENEIAKRLVDKHKYFASEVGEGLSLSKENALYLIGLSIPIRAGGIYFGLGSGRWYDTIGDLAKEKGHRVRALENDPLMHLSFIEKVGLLGTTYLNLLWVPLSYYD